MTVLQKIVKAFCSCAWLCVGDLRLLVWSATRGAMFGISGSGTSIIKIFSQRHNGIASTH